MFINTIIENLNPPKNRRQQLREIEGTPSFTENNPSISSGEFWILDFEDDHQYGKWTPLNLVVIDNTSTSDLEVQINQNSNQAISVPSNNTKTINRDGIRQLKIIEESGQTVDAGEVEVTFTRQAIDSDEIARNRKKTLLNLK